jgi:flagellar FlgN protein
MPNPRAADRTDAAVGHADPFAGVAAVLWSEREILERVLFAVTTERLVLESGQTRWLARADQQVQDALEVLRTSEVLRSAEVQALADQLNLPFETNLAGLASIAPEPWPYVLNEHRTALRDLTAEIDAVTTDIRRLLHAGAQAIGETLDRLGDAFSAYTANGAVATFPARPIFIDEQA